MSLQTKIRETKHYVYRVEVSDRLEGKDIKYANKTFNRIIKKVKKGKIIPRAGNKPGTQSVYFKGLCFIYAKNQDGTYTLITLYDTLKKPDQECNELQLA